jgi:hypothetical protein
MDQTLSMNEYGEQSSSETVYGANLPRCDNKIPPRQMARSKGNPAAVHLELTREDGSE